jgi:hypothetical protein
MVDVLGGGLGQHVVLEGFDGEASRVAAARTHGRPPAGLARLARAASGNPLHLPEVADVGREDLDAAGGSRHVQ